MSEHPKPPLRKKKQQKAEKSTKTCSQDNHSLPTPNSSEEPPSTLETSRSPPRQETGPEASEDSHPKRPPRSPQKKVTFQLTNIYDVSLDIDTAANKEQENGTRTSSGSVDLSTSLSRRTDDQGARSEGTADKRKYSLHLPQGVSKRRDKSSSFNAERDGKSLQTPCIRPILRNVDISLHSSSEEASFDTLSSPSQTSTSLDEISNLRENIQIDEVPKTGTDTLEDLLEKRLQISQKQVPQKTPPTSDISCPMYGSGSSSASSLAEPCYSQSSQNVSENPSSSENNYPVTSIRYASQIRDSLAHYETEQNRNGSEPQRVQPHTSTGAIPKQPTEKTKAPKTKEYETKKQVSDYYHLASVETTSDSTAVLSRSDELLVEQISSLYISQTRDIFETSNGMSGSSETIPAIDEQINPIFVETETRSELIPVVGDIKMNPLFVDENDQTDSSPEAAQPGEEIPVIQGLKINPLYIETDALTQPDSAVTAPSSPVIEEVPMCPPGTVISLDLLNMLAANYDSGDLLQYEQFLRRKFLETIEEEPETDSEIDESDISETSLANPFFVVVESPTDLEERPSITKGTGVRATKNSEMEESEQSSQHQSFSIGGAVTITASEIYGSEAASSSSDIRPGSSVIFVDPYSEVDNLSTDTISRPETYSITSGYQSMSTEDEKDQAGSHYSIGEGSISDPSPLPPYYIEIEFPSDPEKQPSVRKGTTANLISEQPKTNSDSTCAASQQVEPKSGTETVGQSVTIIQVPKENDYKQPKTDSTMKLADLPAESQQIPLTQVSEQTITEISVPTISDPNESITDSDRASGQMETAESEQVQLTSTSDASVEQSASAYVTTVSVQGQRETYSNRDFEMVQLVQVVAESEQVQPKSESDESVE